MSNGNYQFHVVVRRKGKHYASCTASEMPLSDGWRNVERMESKTSGSPSSLESFIGGVL